MRKVKTLSFGATIEPAMSFYHTNTFVQDDEIARLLASPFQSECRGYEPWLHTTRFWNHDDGTDLLRRMLYTDLKTYLPGDILVKVDRMSMAHSLEVRAPILDFRVVEFAATLPSAWKMKRWESKHVLKKAFRQILPSEILTRRKHGFTVPLDAWFRDGLRVLGQQSLLDDATMGAFFSMSRVQELWNEHQSRAENHGQLLWSLLSFALWHKEYME